MKKFTIGTKILILLCCTLITAVGVFLYLATNTFLKDKIGFAFELNRNTINTVSSDLDSALGNAIDKLRTVSALAVSDLEKQKYIIEQLLDEDPILSSTHIYELTQNGSLKPVYSRSKSTFVNESNIPTDMINTNATVSSQAHLGEIQSKDLVIWNASLSKNLGLIAIGLKIQIEKQTRKGNDVLKEQSNIISVGYIKTERFLKALTGSPVSELYVLDNSGRILIHSNPDFQIQKYNFTAIPIVQDFMKSSHLSDVKRYSYANGDYLGAFTRTEFGGLGVFSSIESSAAFDAVGMLLKRAIIFGLIVFFSVIIISQFFSYSLTVPLRNLLNATFKIAAGELGSTVDVKSNDEIGQLATSFNQMSMDLRKSRQELVDVNLGLEEKVRERTAQLEELATKDPLTGAYNRRYFNTRLQEEIDRAKRNKSPVGLIYLDIDHFKKYNDGNGHPAGDALLKHFVEVIKLAVRKTDILARLGGEEFCFILPDTKLDSAQLTAEKVRSFVEKTPFVHGEKQPMGRVTCSLGVSEFPSVAGDIEGMVKAADEALYHVKQKSRNAVGVGVKATDYTPSYIPVEKSASQQTQSADEKKVG